jgi:hypothetical protein
LLAFPSLCCVLTILPIHGHRASPSTAYYGKRDVGLCLWMANNNIHPRCAKRKATHVPLVQVTAERTDSLGRLVCRFRMFPVNNSTSCWNLPWFCYFYLLTVGTWSTLVQWEKKLGGAFLFFSPSCRNKKKTISIQVPVYLKTKTKMVKRNSKWTEIMVNVEHMFTKFIRIVLFVEIVSA